MFGAEQEARAVEDSWEGTIAAHMALRSETTMAELLTKALGILDEGKHGPAEQKRAARILTRLGYQRVQRRNGKVRSWVYVTTSPLEEPTW